MERAAREYPSIAVQAKQAGQAAEAVALARSAYLPRTEFMAQVNRATSNNVFGLLLPQTVVSPISGPLVEGDKFRNVWGTATGLLVGWEPFDFGRRKLEVASAEAGQKRAEAAVDQAKLEAAGIAADAYLSWLAAEETIAASRASVARVEQLQPIVRALVQAELRPGHDLTRLELETAQAEMQAARAQQGAEMAKVTVQQMSGLAVAAPQPLQLHTPAQSPNEAERGGVAAEHPALQAQQRRLEELALSRQALLRSGLPKLETQANVYGRGSGTNLNGPYPGGANGLAPNIGNWAVGAIVRFSWTEWKQAQLRVALETSRREAEQQRLALLQRELAGQAQRSQASWQVARTAAAVAPRQAAAARTVLEQALARYRAGLGTMVEVIDAQRQLTVAETDERLAQLAVVRAELQTLVARGDLGALLQRAKQLSTGEAGGRP